MRRFQLSIAAIVFAAASANSALGKASFDTGVTRNGQAETSPTDQKSPREVYGKIASVDGSRLTIQIRTGTVQVDAAAAVQAHRVVPLVIGHAVVIRGASDAKGILHADTILRAKESPATWPPDR